MKKPDEFSHSEKSLRLRVNWNDSLLDLHHHDHHHDSQQQHRIITCRIRLDYFCEGTFCAAVYYLGSGVKPYNYAMPMATI